MQVFHVLALVGGLTLCVFSDHLPTFGVIGGVISGDAAIVLIYEVIMIIFVFKKKVNHRVRLLVVSSYIRKFTTHDAIIMLYILSDSLLLL